MLLDIRQKIEGLLTPFLGQYLLPNSSTTPSFWVGFVDQPRAGTNVTGLEAVLDLSSLDVVRQYGAEISNTRIRLHLLQWDGDQLDAAITALCDQWPGTRTQPVRLPEGWGLTGWVSADLLTKEVLG